MASQLFKFKFMNDEKNKMENRLNLNAGENQITMSDETFIELRNFIYKECGIYYTESKKYLLESRINRRLSDKKINSYDDYLNIIKQPEKRVEINALLDAITINETYFFRAEQQFEAFEKIISTEILSLKSNVISPTFRIWSAACSSGEEPYTLALIINEKLKPLFPNVQFQILASDINTSVLDTAKNGIYKEYSMRSIPEYYLKKYFNKQANNYILNEEIKKMVNFIHLNLFDPAQIRMINNCDVIFCCNVLIYFDIPSKQQVVSHLYDSLNKGGYLFIGYSESLHGITKAFKLIHLPKALAYKKEVI